MPLNVTAEIISSHYDMNEEKLIKEENCDNQVSSTTDSNRDKMNVTMELNSLNSQTDLNKSDDMEEDDVPPDFFDDFSNKDFLAGLDVVDAWEDGFTPVRPEDKRGFNLDSESPTETVKKSSTETVKKSSKLSTEKVDEKNKIGNKIIKIKTAVKEKKNDRTDRHKIRRPRSHERRSRSKGKRSKSREIRERRHREDHSTSPQRRRASDRASDEARRDPNKTKRDIQRDKLKCAKDKEAKIISEKLRVVETGLVPPGMEMDVDLNEINTQEEQHKRSRSHERVRRPKRQQSRSASPKIRKKYRSPIRYGSPLKRQPSPVRFSPTYNRRYRTFSRRSPVMIRERSLDRRMWLEERLSPYEKRKWSTPPLDRKRLSERDSSRHSRDDRSPSRKKTCSFLDELDHKLSVKAAHDQLRDIRLKINGGPIVAEILNKYAPQPVPMPVPCPNSLPLGISTLMSIPPPNYQTPVYDQQFFIGASKINFCPVPVVSQPNYMQQPPMHMANHNEQPMQYYEQPTLTPVVTKPDIPNKEDVNNLFNDDNISLSNFLAITERVTDVSKSIDINNKVKVITRCQDAIKIMTENVKPSGRFFYRGTTKIAEKPPEMKGISPMKRVLPIRFHFTTKATMDEKYNTPINRLLLKLGVKDPPPLTSCKETLLPIESLPPGRHDPLRTNVLMKTTQTDVYKCEDCEERKKKEYVDVGVQCQVSGTAEFGCQVVEDDFLNTARSALKNILKNQSLASMTPAQILAQLGHKPEEKKELFPAARKLSEVSPEKKQRDDYFNPRPQPADGFERNRMDSWGASFDRNPAPVSPVGPGSDRFQRPAYPGPSQNFAAPSYGGSLNYHGQMPNHFGANNYRNLPRPVMGANPFLNPPRPPTGRYF